MIVKLWNKLKWWLYRRKHGMPHPREINPFLVERTYLRELAKLYCSGFTLNQCSSIIQAMKCPDAPVLTRADGSTYKKLWISEKQFYGQKLTNERLRQLVWKIWRDQHVGRKL